MSKFDLSKATDFARVTTGLGAQILQGIVNNPQEWDILEGSFNEVKFHIFQSKSEYQGAVSDIQDTGGRRKVKYTYPYTDGQTTDDLGRKAESFTFNIVLHGDRYMVGFKKLMRELNKPTPGTLIHPVRGAIRCVMEDHTIMHKSEERKSMAISLTMIEHNFFTNELERISEDVSVKSKLSRALDAFKLIERAILKVQAASIYVQSVRNTIASALTQLNTNYATLLGKMNTTYNIGPGGTSNDIPALLPVNNGGNLNGNGTQSSNTFNVATTPSDPFQSVPVDTINDSQSLALTTLELEKEVNSLRTSIDEIIKMLKQLTNGSLEFYQEIIDLKTTAIYMQEVLEKGKQSSRAQIVNYKTPRVMTIREVAFANSIEVNRVDEIELMNPFLDSVNYIPQGTAMRLPV